MPSRVIRDGLLTSKTLKSVPREVELTFVHLLLVVDDYGRFEADPDVLASALYPTRRDIAPQQVLAEVQVLAEGDDPAVRFYSVDGRDYLVMTGHEKHRSKSKRGARSKYPEPPADPRGSPRIPATSTDPQPGSGWRVAGSECRVSGLEPERAAPAQTPAQEPEPQAPASRARTKRKPVAELTLAPDELGPEDRKRLLAWIERRGFGWFRSRLPDEVETCLAHFRANGAAKADWYATAQNWIVRAIDGGGDFPPMSPERREEIAKRTRHQLAAKRIDAEIAAEQQPAAPARASPVESVSQVEPLEIPGLRVVTFGSAT